MRAALEAMSTSAPRSGQDLESFSFHPSSANVDISQQEALRLAAQDAEAALQSVQAQLTEATQDRRRLLKEVGDVKVPTVADHPAWPDASLGGVICCLDGCL